MDNAKIEQIINKHQDQPHALIQVLLAIQSQNHWLPKEVLDQVSEKLAVPMSQVMQIATFYKTFSLIPKARNEVQVCTGSSCHVRGSTGILDQVQELTGIRPGETDSKARFSLETINCLGCCNLGPEIVVNGEHHAKMTPARVEKVLKDYE